MQLVPVSDVRAWTTQDPSRWKELNGVTAVGPNGRKTIWSASEREIHYDRVGLDFDQTQTFLRKFQHLEVPPRLAALIDADLEPQRIRANERAAVKAREAAARQQAIKAREKRDREATESLLRAREKRLRDNEVAYETKRHTYYSEMERLKVAYLERANDFYECLRQREVSHLVHFTRLSNVPSLLQAGLLPRSQNSTGTFNDEHRLDHQLHCSSLSISFPNYKLFSKFRSKFPDVKWAVLVLDTRVVSDHLCFFNQTNAANSVMSTTALAERSSLMALESMFLEVVPGPDRQSLIDRYTLGLDDSHPTDPQAEVLIFGRVDPSYIRAIHVANSEDNEELATLTIGASIRVPIIVDPRYFRWRADHIYWSSMSGQ